MLATSPFIEVRCRRSSHQSLVDLVVIWRGQDRLYEPVVGATAWNEKRSRVH
jgi:hypothetical protein